MFTTVKSLGHCKRFMNLSASSLLSKENKQACVEKFQEMVVKQGSQPTKKRAAVLIPIYVKDDEVSLLYTLRAASLNSHRGQVSFPGGMFDTSDASLEQTALRETEEELGIFAENIEIWGRGQPIMRRDLSIVPIIGRIRDNFDLNNIYLNHNEVEQVFTVPIWKLTNSKFYSHTQFRGSFTTPTYFGGSHRIWGLTGVITFMFLKSLLSRQDYNHRIQYIPDVSKIVTTKS